MYCNKVVKSLFVKRGKVLQNTIYGSGCEQIEMGNTEMTRGLIRSITHPSEVTLLAHTPRILAIYSVVKVKVS